jgi:GYF domain 2
MNYYILDDGVTKGPYTIGQLRSMWDSGAITVETPYRPDGASEWKRLGLMKEALEKTGIPPSSVNPKPKSFFAGCGCLTLVAIAVALIIILALSDSDENVTETGHREGVIYKTTTRIIAQNLRSPSTAKFPSFYEKGAVAFRSLGENRYRISSYVDAQNAFGATIRNYWLATVIVTGDNVKIADYQLGEIPFSVASAVTSPIVPRSDSQEFCTTQPPSGYRGFRWGDAPTGSLKKRHEGSDGNVHYSIQDGAKSGPLFGVPVMDELFFFSKGRFYGAMTFLEGKDNAEIMREELTRRFGRPSFQSSSANLLKWQWKDGPIDIYWMYQEDHERTTVSFANGRD